MFLGADTAALRALARMLETAAITLAERALTIRGLAAALAWLGPDADDFSGSLEELLERWEERIWALRRLARVLEQQAQEQDLTSAAEDGGDGWSGLSDTVRLDDSEAPAGSGTGPMHPLRVREEPDVPVIGVFPSRQSVRRGAQELEELFGDASELSDPHPIFGPLARRPEGMGEGGALDDRVAGIIMPDEGPSQGLVGDALGEEAALRWNDLEIAAARGGRQPGPGALAALGVDQVNTVAGAYEALQGVRDGDAFSIADGLLTRRLAQGDALARGLMLSPAAPIGIALTSVTGTAAGLWAGLRHDALQDPDAEGSPTRYLFQTPTRLDEQYVQPLARSIGGPVGEAIGTAGETVAGAQQEIEADLDRGTQGASEAAQRHVPGLRVALDASRGMVEAPRHAVEELLGR